MSFGAEISGKASHKLLVSIGGTIEVNSNEAFQIAQPCPAQPRPAQPALLPSPASKPAQAA